jgi:hypothetical protein
MPDLVIGNVGTGFGNDTSDITTAFNTIRDKRARLDLLFNYLDGPQPLKYSTYKLAEVFDNLNAHFELNWCAPIVDAVLDRLELTGFNTKDATANQKFSALFDKLHLDTEADKVHRAALATSQGYIIAWKEEDNEIVAYYNDPRICAVFYDPAKPRKKQMAAKWFDMEDGKQEITLYYPDRIEHWQSQKSNTPLDKASGFSYVTHEANPYGVIPVFELKSISEFEIIITEQNAVNKLFADMMVASEYSVAPMRWMIGQIDPGDIKNGANLWFWLPAGDGQGQPTSVGQFDAPGLKNFMEGIDFFSEKIFTQTRTPKNYLMSSSGANLSGEALLAMEAPLIKKCKKRQTLFGAQWQDIAAFLFLLDGVTIAPSDISPVWARIESVQPYTEAQTMQLMINTGVPLITYLRRVGWTEAELEQLATDVGLQKKAQTTLAQATLESLRIEDQQSNDTVAE